MSPILSRSTAATQYGGRPPAAIELTSEGVLAAALLRQAVSRPSMPLNLYAQASWCPVSAS